LPDDLNTGWHFFISPIKGNHSAHVYLIQLKKQTFTRKNKYFNAINMTVLNINNQQYSIDVPPEMPLLWVIRDVIGLTGTKYGCGMAQCGACTIHLDGEAVRSCVTPVQRAVNKNITTIEGLSPDNSHPLQAAWLQVDAPQCGYCQSGQLMSAAVLLKEKPDPTDQDIDDAMSGNICRCGTYPRIRKAIHIAAQLQKQGGNK
jgi:isoquinoline 1-oxidoreductase subunit alpha